MIFAPNSEPQNEFLTTPAFETLYGGAAGGGKSLGITIAAILNANNSKHRAILFRRTFAELSGSDGLIESSWQWYPSAKATYRAGNYLWTFPSGATVRFGHMATRNAHYAYQGHQFTFVGFDELGHFGQEQYLYLFSRVRSDAKIPMRVCATSNPGARWIRDRWAPWLDANYANPASSGEIRYYKLDESGAEIECDAKDENSWSRTFIASSWRDNPNIGDDYVRNLDMLPFIERERLKNSNWMIEEGAGTIFKSDWFNVVDFKPVVEQSFRFWDFAGTAKTKNNDPDYTATALVERCIDGKYYVTIERDRANWATAKKWVKRKLDTERATIHGSEEEGGASGKAMSAELINIANDLGLSWRAMRPETNKIARAMLWSSHAENGLVNIVKNEFTDELLFELHSFPQSQHDDMVDAISGAFSLIRSGGYTAEDLRPVIFR